MRERKPPMLLRRRGNEPRSGGRRRSDPPPRQRGAFDAPGIVPDVPAPQLDDKDDDPQVSLAEAARRAYFNATGKHTDDVATLNNLARVIAQNTRLFTRAHDEADHDLVMQTEVEEGQFHQGGAYLEFHDSRPALGHLSILRRELPALLHDIRDLIKGHAAPARRPN